MVLHCRMVWELKYSWHIDDTQPIFIFFFHPRGNFVGKLLIKNHQFPLKINRSLLTNLVSYSNKSKYTICQVFADLERASHQRPSQIRVVEHLHG